jgi:DNA-directed RNA polymerase subunit omega
LDKVDSKYTLVHLAARRAREINSYYHSLGEGLGQYTPPLVEEVDSNKPLSIALEEIAAEKIVPQYPGDARRAAEEFLGGELDADLDAASYGDRLGEAERAEGIALVAPLDEDPALDADDTGEADADSDTQQ